MSSQQKKELQEQIAQLAAKLAEKAGYSAKAAHQGKDLGKKGKNFEKIAKSAGKKYGSKAAGERVAGAVLNKLRNESLDESQDSTGLDGKVIPIETHDFIGKAYIGFDKVIGKHNMHRFWVKYVGEAKKTGDVVEGDVERLDVYPFDVPLYKTTSATGKNLEQVLAKSAPTWVSVNQLDPIKEGMEMFLNGELDEKLKPSMGISAYIDDFVHSKNKRFAGKSKEQRIKMAKGAYYGAMKESESSEPSFTTSEEANREKERLEKNGGRYQVYGPAFGTGKYHVQRLDAVEEGEKEDHDAGYRYYIVDRHTKKVVGKAKTLAGATKAVDKRDNEYGGYRFSHKKIEQGLTEEAADPEHMVITPELLLRTMEWAKESGGEDIQLHKYVEAMTELLGSKEFLDSDDYEHIISLITPNDPEIKDEGPGSSEEDEH